MLSDHAFSRLSGLVVGSASWAEPAALPPDVYEVWRKNGLAFGKFVLLEEIGRGGSSVVHAAWEPFLQRKVALKIITGLDPTLRARFQREIRIAGGLSHPGILPVYESGESGASLWLAMPLVDGVTLDRVEGGPLEAACAVAAAARAVQAAHDAGVVHRDLKPGNIMRDASGIRVLDFGLARADGEASEFTQAGQVLGTPQYMAPEQAAGRPADRRTDVYSLGATLYRLATGRAPFEPGPLAAVLQRIAAAPPPPPRELRPGIPPGLEAVILKAMEREPSRRYESAAALADDLESFARGGPVSARGTGTLARLLARTNRRAIRAAAGLFLAAGLLLAGFHAANKPAGASPSLAAHEPSLSLEALADSLQRQGKYDAAIDLYTQSLAKEPGNPDVLRIRARCFSLAGRPKEEEADLTRVIEGNPRDVSALRGRAGCRMSRENWDGALEDADAALALEPHDAGMLVLRGEVFLTRGDIPGALECESAAVRFEPENPWAWAALALVQVRAGRFEAAISDYDKAIRFGGRQAKWLVARGRAKISNADGPGALSDLEAAVSAEPKLAADCAADVAEAKRLVTTAKDEGSK